MNKVYQFELDYIFKKIILRGYFIFQVMKIGLDTMGGDFAPSVTVKGAIQAQQELAERFSIVLIGDKSKIYKN